MQKTEIKQRFTHLFCLISTLQSFSVAEMIRIKHLK